MSLIVHRCASKCSPKKGGKTFTSSISWMRILETSPLLNTLKDSLVQGKIHAKLDDTFKFTTFGDLDGQELHWPPTSHFRPLLLAIHAAIAVCKAQKTYGYQKKRSLSYHLSGDLRALGGIEAFSSIQDFVLKKLIETF